jgi:hypothetical protein
LKYKNDTINFYLLSRKGVIFYLSAGGCRQNPLREEITKPVLYFFLSVAKDNFIIIQLLLPQFNFTKKISTNHKYNTIKAKDDCY